MDHYRPPKFVPILIILYFVIYIPALAWRISALANGEEATRTDYIGLITFVAMIFLGARYFIKRKRGDYGDR